MKLVLPSFLPQRPPSASICKDIFILIIMENTCSNWQSFMLHYVAVSLQHPLLLIVRLYHWNIPLMCTALMAMINSSAVSTFQTQSHLFTLSASAYSFFQSLFLSVDHCRLPSCKWQTELSAFKESHREEAKWQNTHTQMQTRAVSSVIRSKRAEQQKYHPVMWINHPISQLEVYGLLFPNCHSLESVGILIAAMCLPSLSACLTEEKLEKEDDWSNV